jgi:hypothetical protein
MPAMMLTTAQRPGKAARERVVRPCDLDLEKTVRMLNLRVPGKNLHTLTGRAPPLYGPHHARAEPNAFAKKVHCIFPRNVYISVRN